MLRALGKFLKVHKVDMKQFEAQARGITKRINNYNVDKIKAKNVAVGDKAQAGGSKNKPSAS
jgi:hypothetical protein